MIVFVIIYILIQQVYNSCEKHKVRKIISNAEFELEELGVIKYGEVDFRKYIKVIKDRPDLDIYNAKFNSAIRLMLG